MIKLSFLGCLAVLLATPAYAQSHSFADAERAYQDVDFPTAHSLAQQVLQAGDSSPEQTARLYVLLGISAAAQGDSIEAKQDFVVALAVNPTLKLDKSLSPKIRAPYLEAQGYWAAASARLGMSAKPGSDQAHLIVRLVDPAALVDQVVLHIAPQGVLPRSTFQLPAVPVTRFALPSEVRAHDYEYALRALDRYGNVLSELGSDADPQLATKPSASDPGGSAAVVGTPRGRSYALPATLGLAGLAAAGAGVIFHVEREHEAQLWNGPSCESPGQTRLQQCATIDRHRQTDERLAVGFYAAGGALLTGSIISLLVGRPAEPSPPRAGLLGCLIAGTSVNCEGRF